MLRTHDDTLISITTRGVRAGPLEVVARLARGEPVDPADYYFRVVATFETGAPAYFQAQRAALRRLGDTPDGRRHVRPHCAIRGDQLRARDRCRQVAVAVTGAMSSCRDRASH